MILCYFLLKPPSANRLSVKSFSFVSVRLHLRSKFLISFAGSCIETNMLVAAKINYIPLLKIRVKISISKVAVVRIKFKLKVRRAC